MIEEYVIREATRRNSTLISEYVLVDGAKRKIKLWIRRRVLEVLDKNILLTAGMEADKRGWKQAVLQPDEYMGETVELMNLHQYGNNSKFGKMGIFIAAPDGWAS